MRRLSINALESELEAAASFCRAESLGIEVTAFAFPHTLSDELDASLARHAAAVAGIVPVSVHGPFLDLYPASRDKEVVALARRRHEQGLRASAALGATLYVAHLSYLPIIRNRGYRDGFAAATAEFWTPLADEAASHGITVVLENLWEPGPEMQRAVLDHARHPALKASFDNGHALVFSNVPAATWIEVIGADLAHCHLHDNDGQEDQHGVIGTGREEWEALFAAMRRHASDCQIVLESDDLARNRASVAAARIYAR